MNPKSITDLPHRIAVLCYLYDDDDRLLLLHRSKSPNAGQFSPIGGKLEADKGESPHACAVREIQEEAGIKLATNEIRLSGILAETAYESETHWLIFLYEVTRTIDHSEIANMEMDEGTLEWIPVDDVESIGIPETDQKILWPLVRKHRGGFFALHIDCSVKPFKWTVQEEWTATDV